MYRLIHYQDLKEGDMIQFYGCHVLRWEREFITKPDYAFVEDDEVKKLFKEHREKAFVTCDETCFCWDIERMLE